MDARNYASLEASRRLIEAGIVLETEAYWWKAHKRIDWILRYRNVGIGYMLTQSVNCIPAPCMAEVWRELPECVPYDDTTWAAWRMFKQGDLTRISAAAYGMEFTSMNPTDALIDLLIWVRKGSAINAQEGEHELG